MASIFSDPRFAPFLQATPMSGRIAEPVSLFTRYVPPVVEEEPEEEEVAQAPLAPVAPVYYPRPQPVDQGGGYDMPVQQSAGSGNFFTDLKGLVSPVTDLFAPSTPEVMSDAELGSMVRDALDNPTVSQGAPVTPVTLEESTEYRLGQPITTSPEPVAMPVIGSDAPISLADVYFGTSGIPSGFIDDQIARDSLRSNNISLTPEGSYWEYGPSEPKQQEEPFGPGLFEVNLVEPVITSPYAFSVEAPASTPVDAVQAEPQTGEVNPAAVGVPDPNTGVTVYGDEFMTAPAPDPYEPGALDEVTALFGYPDGRTYTAGRFNALGEDTTREGFKEDDQARSISSKVGAMLGPSLLGPVFGGMIAGSRIGAEEGPYGRDAAGNYRFNAVGPMGTVQSPYGVRNLGPAYGRVATNDYSGLYGLGTVGNTGRSATDMMFDDVGYKGGKYGYGIGFKAEGSFGSLDEWDVQDLDAIYENTRDFSFNPDDQGGGGDVGGVTSEDWESMGDTWF